MLKIVNFDCNLSLSVHFFAISYKDNLLSFNFIIIRHREVYFYVLFTLS